MRSYFAIVEGDAEQPWFTRIHADNFLEVWRSSENYVDCVDAERAVCIVAEALYRGHAHLEEVPAVRPGDRHEARIILDLEGSVARLSVPVVYLDERQRCRVCGCTLYEPCDPPCSWAEPDLCSNPECVTAASDGLSW